jgi:hypothetical protein
MKGAIFLLVGILGLSSWTWAGSSACAGADCSTSVRIGFRIVIPPPPLTTKRFSELPSLITRTAPSTGAASSVPRSNSRSEISSPDGVFYIPADDGTNTYTVVKP